MNRATNVLHGAQWAATPTEQRTREKMQQTAQGGLWARLKSKFRWETLTVAGREVKGFVISPAIATILLTAVLGVIGWAYKSSTTDARETRDAVIRMETMLNERTRNFEREQDKFDADLKDERRLNQLHRENQDKKQKEIVLALRAKGINIE